ncbi:MAG: diaminopimelate epimerase [Actinomycetales bacterium]
MIQGTYGHGTENDFVLIFDPTEQLEITADICKRICDRTTGVGSDGLIRITKKSDKWFMDYRNSDGSIAEMCGNGIRVMARYLVDRGHQGSGIFPISTRDGNKFVSVPSVGDITVNMGQISSMESEISVSANGKSWPAQKIEIGNPHAVSFVDDLNDVGDLAASPAVNPESEFPEGVNYEFVVMQPNGELAMRVHERGVGETKSCGTGTCAVALAATLVTGRKLPAKWVINPPGGRLEVEIDAHSNAILTGPAVLLKEVDLDRYFE